MGLMAWSAFGQLSPTAVSFFNKQITGATNTVTFRVTADAGLNPQTDGFDLIGGFPATVCAQNGATTNTFMPGGYWLSAPGWNRPVHFVVPETNVVVNVVTLITNLPAVSVTGSPFASLQAQMNNAVTNGQVGVSLGSPQLYNANVLVVSNTPAGLNDGLFFRGTNYTGLVDAAHEIYVTNALAWYGTNTPNIYKFVYFGPCYDPSGNYLGVGYELNENITEPAILSFGTNVPSHWMAENGEGGNDAWWLGIDVADAVTNGQLNAPINIAGTAATAENALSSETATVATNLTFMPQYDFSTNGVRFPNGQLMNYPSSTTAGIQEVWDAVQKGVSLTNPTNQVLGAVFKFAPAYYFTSAQVNIDSTNPFDLLIEGSGPEATKWIYTGSANFTNGFFHFGGAPITSSFKPLDLIVQNIGFGAINQSTNTMVYCGQPTTMGDFSYIAFDLCSFESWQVMTNYYQGASISKYLSLSPGINIQTPGLVGLQINSTEEHQVSMVDDFFAGNCGAFILCDHLTAQTLKFAYCDVTGTALNRGSLWNSNFLFGMCSPFIVETSYRPILKDFHFWDSEGPLAMSGNPIFENMILEQNISPAFPALVYTNQPATFLDCYNAVGQYAGVMDYSNIFTVEQSGSSYLITNIPSPLASFDNHYFAGTTFAHRYSANNFYEQYDLNNGEVEGNGFSFFGQSYAVGNIGSGNTYPVVTATGFTTSGVNGVYGYSSQWTAAFPGELVLTNPASAMCIVSNDAAAGDQWIAEQTNQINQGNLNEPIYTANDPAPHWEALGGGWATAENGSSDNSGTSTYLIEPFGENYLGPSNIVCGVGSFVGSGLGITMATNYTPSTWTPIPGNVIFRPSNDWVYAITTLGTNAAFKTAP